LIALADDEIILGHRVSEWCGHAPILEEDIAFANIALDEIGHARLWLELAAKEMGQDPSSFPDKQAFFRTPAEFRNLPLAELPNGDWAFSMLRQYLFDSFEIARLEALSEGKHAGLSELSAKIRTEELYHLRHTKAWVMRLAQGTDESKQRSQAALDALWPYAQSFAVPLPGESELIKESMVPSSAILFETWRKRQTDFFSEIGLTLPTQHVSIGTDRFTHTEHLAELLTDMQEVARLVPEGRW
jgi:ring-1,2-phenylacetyl-CoA epoxidase subunit PaaC